MTAVEPSEVIHLRAAEGWVELGLPEEALKELEVLPAARREQPLVLMLLWRIYSAAGRWRDCIEVADELVQRDSKNLLGWIHRSYALHELKRTQEASDLLEPALLQFPDEELVAYNLACYACQLGREREAKALLVLAFRRGDAKEIKQRALEDSDLATMRDYIARLKV
jgi:predicted Zn-dependent protease